MKKKCNDSNLIYQRIGEYAVSFQWLEHRIRETGWLLIDPDRKMWLPTELRDITNNKLLNRVNDLYLKTLDSFTGDGVKEYCDSFKYVIDRAHKVRQERNNLLHSAYFELKAGGEVMGIMQSNPRLVVEDDGEYEVNAEILSEENITTLLTNLVTVSVGINLHYSQLIYWAPFDRKNHLEECGLPFHRTGIPLTE